MKRLELVGQRFGRLVVALYSDSVGKTQKKSMWLCKCDCGNEIIVAGGHLTSGHTKSCGCMKNEIIDLTGKKFDRLTVLEYIKQDRWGARMWLCKCACGSEKIVRGSGLTSGHTKSCGCLQKDITSERFKGRKGKKHPNYKHGLYKTKIYKLYYTRKREIAKLNQSPELTEIEKKKLLLYYKISEYLGEGWHVDHIQPISKGGLHHPDNLQVLRSELNLKKCDKYPLTPEEEIEYRGIRI